MTIREILSISGQPGLYKYVAQAKGGIIVETLACDAKRMMVSGSAKVSALGDIAMFTDSKEVALAEIFENLYKTNQGKAVDITSKSTPDELVAFMNIALPSYDRERVHNSDIKKLAAWYNILVGAGFTTFVEADEEQEDASAAVAASATSVAEKKAAKPRKATASTATKQPKQTASSKPKVAVTKSTTARKSS